MIKFPSVEQYRTAIKNVTDSTRWAGRDETGEPIFNSNPLPKVLYRGSVKGHGTNASVVFDMNTRQFSYQSRERVLSLTQDNAGFMLWASSKEKIFKEICFNLPVIVEPSKIVIYGEWSGKGIQKGVAISEVPKFFMIFGIKLWYSEEESTWLDIKPFTFLTYKEHQIFNVFDFGSFEAEIDFAFPQLVQNKFIELTEAVENECPIGKYFGISGCGEGVVWTPDPSTDQWKMGSKAWFKTKGELHVGSVIKLKGLNLQEQDERLILDFCKSRGIISFSFSFLD